MNRDKISVRVIKQKKDSPTAMGRKKGANKGTKIPDPGDNPLNFEMEPGGDDFLDLWVETSIPSDVFIEIAPPAGSDSPRVRIKRYTNKWRLWVLEGKKENGGVPLGVNVTVGEDEL